MGYVPYVGFATHHRATVRTRLCLYKNKNKKSCHTAKTHMIVVNTTIPYCRNSESTISNNIMKY
jgi:hypothetical protein